MTEQEWLAATAPTPMLECLQGKASDRKLRLFAVSCFRRLDAALFPRREKEVIDVAERHADHLALVHELRQGYEALAASGHDYNQFWLRCLLSPSLAPHVQGCVDTLASLSASLHPEFDCYLEPTPTVNAVIEQARMVQADLLRCIFGNPFRSVTAVPSWLTYPIVSLANTVYELRTFDQLPTLADSLQAAGCVDEDILTHCRSDGPHVRGCWVVDLLTGRK